MSNDALARFDRLSREAKRREAAKAEQEALAEQRYWDKTCADLPARMADWYNSGTLGEATECLSRPDWACACSGPMWWPAPPGTPCSCRAQWDRAHRLQHAAHIVANLMLQAVDKPETPATNGDPT